MLHLGQYPEQVAQALMVTSNTVYAWHKCWREQGGAGLRDSHRTGRPQINVTRAKPENCGKIILISDLIQHLRC